MRRTGKWAVAALLGWAATAWAGRPLITNDAEPLDRGKFQLELGVGYVGESDCDHFDLPVALTYGILPRVEAGIGFGGQYECRDEGGDGTSYEEGMSDLTLSVKWKLLDQDKAFLAQAISGTVKFPTADEDKELGSGDVDCDLTWIVTRAITDRTSVLFNLGYTWLGHREDSDVLHYGSAVTFQLTEKWQPVVEIVFETPVDGGKTSAGVNYGVRNQLSESLMLDAAAGSKVAGEWPDWVATIGLTWVF